MLINSIRVNDIAMNMESDDGRTQKLLCLDSYAPKEYNTKIDDINCCYEAICTEHSITYINNQRVTADTFRNIDPKVFFDDLHLNNKIGTKRLVPKIKSRIGLKGTSTSTKR